MEYSRRFIYSLLLLSVGAIAPLFVMNMAGWSINTDFITYALALNHFSSQLWAGDLYPRWLMDANGGFGSPMFLFYGPLPFYAASLLEPFAGLDPNGYGRLIASFIPALFLSGITSYRWLRQHFSEAEAERGALIYAVFPFSILSIYTSFGISHMWAIAFMPLILEAAHDMTQKGWRALPKLASSYALLAFSHLPSTLVFAPIPIAYVAFFSDRQTRVSRTCTALLAGLLGAALAAIYLLPLLANKAFVMGDQFVEAQLIYSNNFHHIRFWLGLCLIFLPLLGFFFELPKAMRKHPGRDVIFWLVILTGGLFMASSLSRPLWDAAPPLQHLRFPFRFFSALLPGALYISLRWIPHIKSKGLYQILAPVCLIIAAYFSFNNNFYTDASPARHIMQHRLIVAPEYRTIWAYEAGLRNPQLLPEPYSLMPAARVIEGSGNITMLPSPRKITLHANIASDNALVLLRRFYFPGWQSDREISEKYGLIALNLPKGEHNVTLSLPWFAGEREGLIVSIFALLVLLTIRRKSHA